MRIFDPIAEFDVIRREMDRVFDSFRNTAPIPARFKSYPLANIAEDADAIHVEALLPGVDPAKLNINVQRNILTISGAKAGLEGVSEDQVHRNERAAGEFSRTFRLPAEVDADRVSADYRNGVLRLVLHKAEAAKPRRIAVAVA